MDKSWFEILKRYLLLLDQVLESLAFILPNTSCFLIKELLHLSECLHVVTHLLDEGFFISFNPEMVLRNRNDDLWVVQEEDG